ncbi:MAG: HD domain-containing protein [Candidatus Hodarchaeales archaeon]|jgi:putative nucleotidyltransferase with HDIG domain
MTELKEYLLSLFPEITEIKDSAIQEKVIATFAKAMELGRWDKVEGIPFTLLIPDLKVDLAQHIQGVTRIAMKTAQELTQHGINLNMDFLIAGALLHDVGKLVEYTKKDGKVTISDTGKLLRHPTTGTWLALEAGLPAEIAHIIYCHSWEGDKLQRTPEAHIVHQADFAFFEPLRAYLKKE